VKAARAIVVLAVLLVATGAPARAVAACPAPLPYPGDAAAKAAIAQWMATKAAAGGLPPELPLMGALVESGLSNLATNDSGEAGYFAIRVSVWNGGAYAGFPDQPQLQMQWFIDRATSVRQARLAASMPDPAADETSWGGWIADALLPAEQDRHLYALRLAEARALIGTLCAAPPPGPPDPGTAPPPPPPPAPIVAPPAADTTAPAVRITSASSQRALRRGAILVSLRCPAEACSASARATVALPGRRALRLTAPRRTAPAGQALALRLVLTRSARAAIRRALRSGRTPRAAVRIVARDAAGNETVLRRTIRLMG
jgi:hypothetical protein